MAPQHLRLAGHAPSEIIILGVNPESCEFGESFSEPIRSIASRAAAMIAQSLSDRSMDCVLRQPAAAPNLWWLQTGHAKCSAAA